MKLIANFILSLIISGCTPVSVKSPERATPTLSIKVSTVNNYQKNVIVPRDFRILNNELGGAVRIRYEMEEIDDLPAEHRESMNLGYIHVIYFNRVINDGKPVAGLHTSGTCGGYIAINYYSANDRTLSHEIGHALGLDHVDDKMNIMGKGRNDGAGFNYFQLTKMRNNAFHLKRLCGR